MKRLHLIFLSSAFLLILSSAEVSACSCESIDPPNIEFANRDAVFHGRPISVVMDSVTSSRIMLRATIQVIEHWKGINSETVEIITERDGAACGIPFDPIDEFLVYADFDSTLDGLYTFTCTRTRLIGGATEDLEYLQTVSIGDPPGVANEFSLAQNFPNPFNPSTMIRYQLASSEIVKLRVFNSAGQQINSLVNGKQGPGNHQVEWDGRDAAGREAASGVYIYHLKAGSFSEVRKMTLIR